MAEENKPEGAAGGGEPAAPPPKPPAAPTGPVPQPWDNEMVARLRSSFGQAVREASTYLGQNYLIVDAAQIAAICSFLKQEEQFDMLADLTATDYPKNPQRFEVIYQLYSFPRNQRLRLKALVGEKESIATMVPVWKAANWLEREVYDMFGVTFAGHPDLRRILLPEEWQGFPLRKDHHILQQDDKWVQENLHIESGQ